MKLGHVVVPIVYYNFTKFHQNWMKNKKVLLIACFSVQNFKVSVKSWKLYIVQSMTLVLPCILAPCWLNWVKAPLTAAKFCCLPWAFRTETPARWDCGGFGILAVNKQLKYYYYFREKEISWHKKILTLFMWNWKQKTTFIPGGSQSWGGSWLRSGRKRLSHPTLCLVNFPFIISSKGHWGQECSAEKM